MAGKKLSVTIVLILIVLGLSVAAAALKTLKVQETELVKITAEALDPDQDNLSYSFSEPLDEKGEWQTGYDDAGEYNLTIIASDGKEKSVVQVQLIVENKNQPPKIIGSTFKVKELETINLKTLVSDPDGDQLKYHFAAPFDRDGLWTPGYQDAGQRKVNFSASDREFTIQAEIELTITEVNQKPEVKDIFSEESRLSLKEGEKLEFFVEAEDADGDQLSYLWQLGSEAISSKPEGEYYLDYDSTGERLLKLTLNDSQDTLAREWTVEIKNTNRRPEISSLPITIKEGEKVILDFPEKDADGDFLTYTFEGPLNASGEWQTSYKDSGKYYLEVAASDGRLQDEIEVEITVIDQDRPPVLNLADKWEVYENETLKVELDVSDPDQDNLSLSLRNAPEEAQLKGRSFTWKPGYSAISRSGGFFSNLLNYLRLEHYFLKSKSTDLELEACGKELCSTQSVELVVYNVNRPPVMEKFDPLVVKETEVASFEAQGLDPDGDIVRYKYGYPLGRDGKWKTDYEDRDTYTVDITATDGQLSVTKPLTLRVTKNNRAPTIKVDDDTMTVNENQEFSFSVKAEDPDTEELDLYLENLPPGAEFTDGKFSWKPNHNLVENKSESWWNGLVSGNNYLNRKYSSEKKTVWLSFVAADEEFDVVHPIKVTIKNVNRAPEIVDYLPQKETTVKMNQPVTFHVAAKDLDQDQLDYHWYFGLNQERVENTDTVKRTFTSPGRKKVAVTVSDGREQIKKEWYVNVEPGAQLYVRPVHLQPAVVVKTIVQPIKSRVYVMEDKSEPAVLSGKLYVVEDQSEPAAENEPPSGSKQGLEPPFTIGIYTVEN